MQPETLAFYFIILLLSGILGALIGIFKRLKKPEK